MASISLVRGADGLLCWMTPEEMKAANIKPQGKSDPKMQSGGPAIDDAFSAMLDQAARQLGMVSIRPGDSPAQSFTRNAQGESWFVKAEMVTPLGGRRVGGRVARREPRLEVTIRPGGREKAEEILSLMQVDAVIHEQRPVPKGRISGR